MNVRELIEALKKCSPHAKVSAWNSADNNEFDVHVVTKTNTSLAWGEVILANCSEQMGSRETVVHQDEEIV